jgi:hypothetical protein
MPAAWTYTSPAPLIPSIVLTGPHQRELWMLPHFTDCPGENLGDAILRGTAGSDPQHSSAGGLPLAKLFGRAKRFTVTGRSNEPPTRPAAHRWSAARGRSRRRPTGR